MKPLGLVGLSPAEFTARFAHEALMSTAHTVATISSSRGRRRVHSHGTTVTLIDDRTTNPSDCIQTLEHSVIEELSQLGVSVSRDKKGTAQASSGHPLSGLALEGIERS